MRRGRLAVVMVERNTGFPVDNLERRLSIIGWKTETSFSSAMITSLRSYCIIHFYFCTLLS